MEEHRANAWMTRVAVIEPIVVIGMPAGRRFALHAAEARLAGIEEMIVGDGDILRLTLDIHGTITFCLISIAARLAVEKVVVVYPNVGIARVERQAVSISLC